MSCVLAKCVELKFLSRFEEQEAVDCFSLLLKTFRFELTSLDSRLEASIELLEENWSP
jgi:hypothetical protein